MGTCVLTKAKESFSLNDGKANTGTAMDGTSFEMGATIIARTKLGIITQISGAIARTRRGVV